MALDRHRCLVSGALAWHWFGIWDIYSRENPPPHQPEPMRHRQTPYSYDDSVGGKEVPAAMTQTGYFYEGIFLT
jgi:hypothetical protein